MEIKTVSIIGLGALGTLYGNHFSKRMPKENLRFIADRARIDKYEKDKVYCNGEACDFHYVTPEESVEPADLLIFAVKYSGLEDAIRAARKHVGENTVILSVLNGITSEQIIGNAYGMDKIVYCVAQGMDATKIGNQLTYKNMGIVCFGDTDSEVMSERVQRVESFFQKKEFPHLVDLHMNKRLWGKFMLNVGVNQTVAMYQSTYSVVLKEGEARDTMIAAMREVMDLSKYEGVNLEEDDLYYWVHVLDGLSPEGQPSMAQDVTAKRYSEVELFSGTIIKLGQKYGVPTPVNQLLYNRIKEIESAY